MGLSGVGVTSGGTPRRCTRKSRVRMKIVVSARFCSKELVVKFAQLTAFGFFFVLARSSSISFKYSRVFLPDRVRILFSRVTSCIVVF